MVDFDELVISPLMDVFAQPVAYRPLNGTPFATTGVFDRAYQELSFNPETGTQVATLLPVLGVQPSTFPAGVHPQQGDRLTVEGSMFEVTNSEPDGHGHVLLKLKKSTR